MLTEEPKTGIDLNRNAVGRLAQVDRALVSGTRGRAFESRIAHQNKNKDLEDNLSPFLLDRE
jgi:hypothetical protein